MRHMEIQKRQTAIKLTIKDCLERKYYIQEGWNPNYILLNDMRKASRINLIGVIVAEIPEESTSKTFVIEDGTGKINLRFFEKEQSNNLSVGDVTLVIGRIREYNGERFILPEIIRKIENSDWIQVRKKEIGEAQTIEKVQVIQSRKEEIISEVIEEESNTDKALNTIREYDSGMGADIQQVIEKIGNLGEVTVNGLLSEGSVFEVSPGKIKVLE